MTIRLSSNGDDFDKEHAQALVLMEETIKYIREQCDRFEGELHLMQTKGIDSCDGYELPNPSAEIELTQLLVTSMGELYLLLRTLHSLKAHHKHMDILTYAALTLQHKHLQGAVQAIQTNLRHLERTRVENARHETTTTTAVHETEDRAEWLREVLAKYRKDKDDNNG